MALTLSVILAGEIITDTREQANILIRADELGVTKTLIAKMRELQRNNQFNKETAYKVLRDMKVIDY